MGEKRRGGRDKKRRIKRIHLKLNWLAFSQWPEQPNRAVAMPPPNVKNDPQRPKHTPQRQSPGKCLHSLRAETFHGQASASQENTPQCSAAISNLWFSSSQNLSPLASPSAQPGFAAAFSLLSQCQPPKHFSSHFSLLSSLPLFYSFSWLLYCKTNISSYHHDYT